MNDPDVPAGRPAFQIALSNETKLLVIGAEGAWQMAAALASLGVATPDDPAAFDTPHPGAISQRIVFALQGRDPAPHTRDLAGRDCVIVCLEHVEAWADPDSGLFLGRPPAPAERGRFRRIGVDECLRLLGGALAMLTKAGPKVILTVSPIPLARTFTPDDRLSAGQYGKSVLRVVAEQVSKTIPGVDYFPLYEIAAGDGDIRRGVDILLQQYCGRPAPPAPAAVSPPARRQALDGMPPLYHSYALFGAENRQIAGIFAQNQACKQPILLAYIQFAIAKCKTQSGTPVSFAELFCADGYYAMAAMHLGATSSMGIDNGRDRYSNHMPEIARRLNIDVAHRAMDVADIDTLPQVDIVANVGGLYHVANPEEILEKSYRFARRFLIVQSVVSIANNDPDYFASPAPGWPTGCRYSPRSFQRMLMSRGWQIRDMHYNELEGNLALEDRGSVYALIEKRPE